MVMPCPWQMVRSGPRSTVCKVKFDSVKLSLVVQSFTVTSTVYVPGVLALKVALVEPSCQR